MAANIAYKQIINHDNPTENDVYDWSRWSGLYRDPGISICVLSGGVMILATRRFYRLLFDIKFS